MAGPGLYDLVIAKVRKRIEECGRVTRPGYEYEEAPKKRRLLQRSAVDTPTEHCAPLESDEALFGDAQTHSIDEPAPPDHDYSTALQPKGAAVVLLAKRPTDPTSTSCISPAARQPETTEATTALLLPESGQMKVSEDTSAAARPSSPAIMRLHKGRRECRVSEDASPSSSPAVMRRRNKRPFQKPLLGLEYYRRLPKDIMAVPGLYDLVIAEVMKQVKEECAKVTRLAFDSVLRKTSLQSLKTFRWDDLLEEWSIGAPTFLKFLQCASSVRLDGPAAPGDTSQGRCKKRITAMAGAMILHARSRRMRAPMVRNSLLLRHKGASKRCLRQFRSQGICVSREQTRLKVKEMGESYHKELPQWKKDTLEVLIPEEEADVIDDLSHGHEGSVSRKRKAESLQSFGSDHGDSDDGGEEDRPTGASAGQSDPPTPVPELIPSAADAQQSPIVQLNVGGHVFSTTLSTLRKQRGSRLSDMFSGQPGLPTDSDGRHFIDRDGTHFGAMLEFLRTGRLPAGNILEVHREAVYYGIKPLVRRLEETPQFFGETVGRKRFISRVPNYQENIEVLIGAARAGAVGVRHSTITVHALRTEADARPHGNTAGWPESAVTFGPWEGGPTAADLLDCIRMDVEAQGYRVCVQPRSADQDPLSRSTDGFYQLLFTWW